ncbi:autotransporter outer membrane beta-barrel domain-containing protein [Methylomonas sp. EFPC3]|uniref:autotransporter outer membrane beta-barrel domain-containing protein n=1 Tax=Methylomonas sp. EFPC3 TaxID=3021710 RepID=UPI002417C763|nr:autotransporter outer membrane beta-barrel domain-containing protein [Methylomonas sp. EFPC3]WFP52196.1 autotransporter outer membrane beta-barrel domain-containing protein [Methylomonas sp. EFPC3]
MGRSDLRLLDRKDFMDAPGRLLSQLPPKPIVAIVAVAALLCPTAKVWAEASSLDEAQFALLRNDCERLAGDRVEFLEKAGPNLYRLCLPTPGGPPGGGAGGAGSVGGGAGSVQSQFVAAGKRLAKLRRQQSKDGGGAGDEAELAFTDGLHLFFSGQFEAIDRRSTRFETGYNGNVQGGAIGADWRANDWLLAGAALNYSNTDSRFANLGGFRVDAFGPALYATLTPNDNAFVDIVLEYARQWRERDRLTSFPSLGANKRPVSGMVSSDFGADHYAANALAGYDFWFGGIVIGPRLGFRYSEMSLDAYRETGTTGLELNFLRDRIRSLQSSVGLMLSTALSTPGGVVAPQISFDWTHEFQNKQRDLRASFVQDGRANPTVFTFNNDRPDRDFYHLGAGIGLTLPNGIQPFVNFDTLLGNRFFDHLVGTVGVRLEL